MSSFHLRIVTPDSMIYDGEADRIVVRTVQGDVAILPRHIDYLTALGDGEARVTFAGHVRKAHCKGGMLHVSGGHVDVLSTVFEWKEDA